jgi:hypothetical protein
MWVEFKPAPSKPEGAAPKGLVRVIFHEEVLDLCPPKTAGKGAGATKARK